MDKITKSEFKKLLEKGREYYEKANQASTLLMNRIIESCPTIDLDTIPVSAYNANANNLDEAINCYMQYGEYDIDSLWDELENALED